MIMLYKKFKHIQMQGESELELDNVEGATEIKENKNEKVLNAIASGAQIINEILEGNSECDHEDASGVDVYMENIRNSVVVKDELIDIFKTILTLHDGVLLSNIVDRSEKVILPGKTLVRLIVTVLNESKMFESEVMSRDVKIRYSDDVITKCLKVRISPFKNVTSIVINNGGKSYNFRTELHEIYCMLYREFSISMTKIYFSPSGEQ